MYLARVSSNSIADAPSNKNKHNSHATISLAWPLEENKRINL